MDDLQHQKWLAERRGGVGASEAGIIMGAQAFGRNELTLYLDKIGKSEPTDDDVADFRRGHAYEALALALAAEATGIAIDRAATADDIGRFCFTAPDAPHLRATLDGMCHDGWLAEAKAPRPHKLAEYLDKGIPDIYDWQIQAQLACCPDAPGCRFVLYDIVSVRDHILEVERDDARIATLTANVEDWWKRVVEGRLPPTAAAGSETRRLKVPSEYVTVEGPEWEEAVGALLTTKQALDAAKADHEEARANLKAMMAGASLEKIACAGHKVIHAWQDGRTRFNKKLLAAEHPDLDLGRYEERGDPFAMFRHYPPKGV